jgi:hypothetical protein
MQEARLACLRRHAGGPKSEIYPLRNVVRDGMGQHVAVHEGARYVSGMQVDSTVYAGGGFLRCKRRWLCIFSNRPAVKGRRHCVYSGSKPLSGAGGRPGRLGATEHIGGASVPSTARPDHLERTACKAARAQRHTPTEEGAVLGSGSLKNGG